MRVSQLSESLSVSGQITLGEVADIASAGFKILINNRPDNEAPNQPTSDEIASAAKLAGLEYYHLPVTARNFPGPDIDTMASLLDDSDNPAFAFCRSGTRCTNLWLSTRSDEHRDACVTVARQYGFDLSMVNVS